MENTSLGQLFTAHGITNWDQMFVKDICEKCQLQSNCRGSHKCDAIIVIGILGTIAVKQQPEAQVFAKNLKDSIGKVHAN
jgi:uncharacterized protein (DUF983 family)